MNDEGIGIAGWLLADLMLVLALLFLAFTPARDASATIDVPATTPTTGAATAVTAEPLAAPLILDIGCEVDRPAGDHADVTCTPQVAGGKASRYGWAAERGEPVGTERARTFRASFEEAGAVTLTISNSGGEHSAAFPVLPAATAASLGPDCSDVQTDFRFAQIVLSGARTGAVSWQDIAKGQVRENVIKSSELDDLGDDTEWSDSLAGPFLWEKLGEGLRIALVETFSNAPGGNHVQLSREVNDVFYDGVQAAGIDIFRAPPDEGRWKWFGDYLAARTLESGEVRLNLYFVKPFDDDCR